MDKKKYQTLDTYPITSRWKKGSRKYKKLLDSEKVDYYLQNNMDVTELYGSDEEWENIAYDDRGNRLPWSEIAKKRENNDKGM